MSACSSIPMKLACAVLMCMVVGEPLAVVGLTCGQVISSLTPCVPYLQRGGVVPPACCNGIKSVNAASKTTPDRQLACRCLKSAAANIKGINYGLAGSLPSKCGVFVPYKISPSTDCSKVR